VAEGASSQEAGHLLEGATNPEELDRATRQTKAVIPPPSFNKAQGQSRGASRSE